MGQCAFVQNPVNNFQNSATASVQCIFRIILGKVTQKQFSKSVSCDYEQDHVG